MVELKCPTCEALHWEIDSDYRGIDGQRVEYCDRPYRCPNCSRVGIGYQLKRRSPPEFFLQPHGLYPMSTMQFAYWLALYREHFPESERLNCIGVSWYPGREKSRHERRLEQICKLGMVQDYFLTISNHSPSDPRPRVCVQGVGEAHFWLDPVELEQHYFGFTPEDLLQIQELVSANATRIRERWQQFTSFAATAQFRCLKKLARVSVFGRWLNALRGREGTAA